jgi:hypothetical protein
VDAGGEFPAYWLDSAGTWAANALLGTLAHLGLIEHGASTISVYSNSPLYPAPLMPFRFVAIRMSPPGREHLS